MLSDFICQTTKSYSFIHTTQYVYEENNQYILVHYGLQATFKSSTFYYVRDRKGLILHNFHTVLK
jgi:hypothetical protein